MQNWREFHDFVLRSAQAKNFTDNRGQSFEITKDMFQYCDRQDPRWVSIKEKIVQQYSARAVLTEDKIDEIIRDGLLNQDEIDFMESDDYWDLKGRLHQSFGVASPHAATVKKMNDKSFTEPLEFIPEVELSVSAWDSFLKSFYSLLT